MRLLRTGERQHYKCRYTFLSLQRQPILVEKSTQTDKSIAHRSLNERWSHWIKHSLDNCESRPNNEWMCVSARTFLCFDFVLFRCWLRSFAPTQCDHSTWRVFQFTVTVFVASVRSELIVRFIAIRRRDTTSVEKITCDRLDVHNFVEPTLKNFFSFQQFLNFFSFLFRRVFLNFAFSSCFVVNNFSKEEF